VNECKPLGGGVDGGVTDVLASFAIVAVPPRVAAAHVAFSPPLPTDQLARMAGAYTRPLLSSI
jgi:monoamine oxidase